MKKSLSILSIIIAILIVGFILGFVLPKGRLCTELACLCVQNFTEPFTGERPCNFCEQVDPIFFTGLINLVNSCDVREIIICQEGKQIGERFDIDKGCKIQLKFLSFYD